MRTTWKILLILGFACSLISLNVKQVVWAGTKIQGTVPCSLTWSGYGTQATCGSLVTIDPDEILAGGHTLLTELTPTEFGVQFGKIRISEKYLSATVHLEVFDKYDKLVTHSVIPDVVCFPKPLTALVYSINIWQDVPAPGNWQKVKTTERSIDGLAMICTATLTSGYFVTIGH